MFTNKIKILKINIEYAIDREKKFCNTCKGRKTKVYMYRFTSPPKQRPAHPIKINIDTRMTGRIYLLK